ncbi:MAG TPA: methylated-DNA--[protein]-cysteine S-methyltransferase [Thermoleophilaceae bacterium]|jgi:methylated-DNA-[protein]-cysteine S-methyltransferase|nr:methylated-DNA--[protein]-cysteine S-methyltransferase [Thermoleophilaceae bacterium]
MTTLEDILRGGDVADAAARASEQAATSARALGLTDVSYAFEPSPMGDLLVAVTPRGLIRLAYNAHEHTDEVLEELARKVSPRVVESPAALDEVRRELDEYFAGKRKAFDIPVDWRLHDGFGRRVLRATARIPFGKVLTYGEVAAKAGSPRGHRAAGNALGSNRMPIVVPCHRVIRSGGKIGGYTGGIERKEYLLELETASVTS